jgi:fatty-acid desaturase
MITLKRVLRVPRYGFEGGGELVKPSKKIILKEFFYNLNIFRSKKNWLAVFAWFTTLSFTIPLFIFFTHYFSFKLAALGFIYSMVVLGSHGTFWFHRYSTHRAFKFTNAFVRELCRNLVIKIVPEEVYVISHHVHHQFSEKPGDPYNVYGGWLYCFLADVNHQAINQELIEKDYALLCGMLANTGVRCNSYTQYKKWGSLCQPGFTILHYFLNWSFWYLAFFLIGGHALATALFGFAGVWAVGIRTFNYEGHGRGQDRRKEGIDFSKDDISINQNWPGYVAGEWHSNHHLYPSGARSGFLTYQLDLPWLFIKSLYKIGVISSFRDFKQDFLNDYYIPYKKNYTEGRRSKVLLDG